MKNPLYSYRVKWLSQLELVPAVGEVAISKQFDSTCKCKSHDQWCLLSCSLGRKISTNKRFSAKVITEMRANHQLSEYATRLCECCYNAYLLQHQNMDSSSSTASSMSSKAPEISNPSIFSSCSNATSPSVADPPPMVLGETSASHTDLPSEPMEDSMHARSGSATLLGDIKSSEIAVCPSSSPCTDAVGTGSCAPIQHSIDFATFGRLQECPQPMLLGYSSAPHTDLPMGNPWKESL